MCVFTFYCTPDGGHKLDKCSASGTARGRIQNLATLKEPKGFPVAC